MSNRNADWIVVLKVFSGFISVLIILFALLLASSFAQADQQAACNGNANALSKQLNEFKKFEQAVKARNKRIKKQQQLNRAIYLAVIREN